MASPSREVLRGRLLHKTKGSGWKKRVVIANCGSSATKKQLSAQLQLFEDYEKVEKHGTKPKKTVELGYAKVSAVSAGSPSGSQTNSPAGAVTGVSISPSPSPRNSLTLSTSPSIHSLTLQGSTSHRFLVTTSNETHEFRTETENDRLRWVKLLGLLVMFPYSVIPEEPQSNPIKESFRCKLDPVQYRADSVWAVYILPEEVGSRCTIIGMNVLALQSGVPNKTVGQLSIFSPTDPSNPVLSWDRDKMRRTGKTGNLVFIEIGRRCQGGPGLVWMYAGIEEAQALRETLHNFLFHGDGKAVAIPTQQANPIYDVPRASFDSSFPPSYQRQASISSGYQHHKFSSQDSGIMSPGAISDEPPPVHLDKHPSFRKKRSAPCDMPDRKGSYHSHNRSPDENSTRNNSNPSMQSADSLLNEETLFQHQESTSPPSRGSVTPPDCGDENSYADSESIMGHMDPDLDEPMPHVRSNTEPALGSRKQVTLGNRAHSTASCEPSRRGEYEKMTHPHAGLYRNGYVYMKPPNLDEVVQESHYASPRSIPVPYAQLQQHLHQPQPDDVYQRLQHFPSKPGPDVSRRNYDRLPPIKEAQIAERNRGGCETAGIEKEKAPAIAPVVPMPSKAEEKSSSRGEEKPSMYENHPLPAHLKNISQVIYKPSYENVNLAHAGRRGSQNQEPYENVTPSGEQIPAEPPTRPIHLIKKGSLRKGRGDKEDVVLPLNGNGLSISGKEVKSPSPPRSKNGYIDVETALVGDRPNHAMRPVAYTSIDLQSTDGFQSIKRERAEQKALVES